MAWRRVLTQVRVLIFSSFPCFIVVRGCGLGTGLKPSILGWAGLGATSGDMNNMCTYLAVETYSPR
jgi:hypothetical protein